MFCIIPWPNKELVHVFYIFVPSVHKNLSTDRTAHLESCVSFLKHYCRICNLCMANI